MIQALWVCMLAAAGIEVFFELLQKRKGILFFKPLATALILAWFACAAWPMQAKGLFALGLGLSLLGDAFLMWPERFFIAGLASFLAAHAAYVAYLASLNLGLPWTALLWPGLAIALYCIPFYGQLLSGMPKAMRLPVAFYMLAIGLMAVLSLSLALQEPRPATWALALGALCFMASDSLLAWGRFKAEQAWHKPVLMALYYLAQIMLAWGLIRF
jgi:alkylglycerol monooxygenase